MAVALGVATATAALTGALLVGDSMRASLRESALSRLGSVDYALVSEQFFRQALADEVSSSPKGPRRCDEVCPAIVLRGGATQVDSHARVNSINVFGVNQSFWNLDRTDRLIQVNMPKDRGVILNEPLARELGVKVGMDLLLRIGKPTAVPTETLLGRRDATSATIRLSVASIVPASGLGVFSLRPSQLPPRNAWMALDLLQRILDRPRRINAIFISATSPDRGQASGDTEWLKTRLHDSLQLEDLGLRIRQDRVRNYLSVESENLLIGQYLEDAIMKAADKIGVSADPLLTYLANRIEIAHRKHPIPNSTDPASARPTVIPYSTVTALRRSVFGQEKGISLGSGQIMLNRWAADDLNVTRGDAIWLTYYITGKLGRLESKESQFILSGILGMNKAVADPGFTPEYKGITDTENLADWDPPFPIDLKLIRDKDEAYWDKYHAAPKAFIALDDGRKLWTDQNARFGSSTAVRVRAPVGSVLSDVAGDLEAALLSGVDPQKAGLVFESVRSRIASASKGTTDFGVLFVSFSFFLIVAAALLAGLFFRLGVEQRTREIGIQLATGFTPRLITRLLVAEGGLVVVLGGVAGLAAAWAYTWLMLAGLRTWWSSAAHAPFLRVHVSSATLAIGFASSAILAIATIGGSIRGLAKQPARSLLAGEWRGDASRQPQKHRSRSLIVAVCFLIAALGLALMPVLTGSASQVGMFFGGGAAMLVACLALFSHLMHAQSTSAIDAGTNQALVRFGVRNASRHSGRSMLTAGLIASATFVVTALAAFKLDAKPDFAKDSGTGGFPLLAESAIGLPYDLNTPEGQESLGITEDNRMKLNGVHAIPFRLRPGDATGCVNLYAPTRPRILGATDAMIDRGGFSFSKTIAETPEEEANPWLLLEKKLPDDAIPVIGDEAAVLWQLHLGLGKDLVIDDERGNPVRLRFVALLTGSILQDELVVAEADFVNLFPSIEGHAFFLLEAPPENAPGISKVLEDSLSTYSFDVTATDQRLAGYLAVQNTYLSTFQTLGGLGLVLGTVGLAAVLLRNVWERRGELALMRALGFSSGALATMVLAENLALVAVGLLAGFIPAMLAVAPHLLSKPGALPWSTIGVTLAATFVVGAGGGAIALIPVLKTPLIPALRRE